MGGQHLDEVYELFLLGTLPAEESAVVREHLERGCSDCLDRLREATQTVYFLSFTTRRAQPDPKLKTHLLRRVHRK